MMLREILQARGDRVTAYVDPVTADWLPDEEQIESDNGVDVTKYDGFAMGIGGIDPKSLSLRTTLFEKFFATDLAAPTIAHPSATVSKSALLGHGSCTFAQAVVQPNVTVGEAVIINTGAIVEHSAIIGTGTHVAPGSVILADVEVGRNVMIGSGAVVLPGSIVPDATLVPSNTRFPK